MSGSQQRERKIEKILGEDGQLLAEAEFNSAGKLDGIERHWNSAGQLILEARYKNRLHDGPYRRWWDTGELKENGSYRNGQRIGLYASYSPDGNKLDDQQVVRIVRSP